MNMKKSFLRLCLEFIGITQVEFSRRMKWSPQRTNALYRIPEYGIHFNDLWQVKECLNLSDTAWIQIQRDYFSQKQKRRVGSATKVIRDESGGRKSGSLCETKGI